VEELTPPRDRDLKSLRRVLCRLRLVVGHIGRLARMAVDPLASAWAKYNWAKQHLDRVHAEVGKSLDPKRHRVHINTEVQPDDGGMVATVRVTKLPKIRQECLLALGDAVNNFRSALDHLAW